MKKRYKEQTTGQKYNVRDQKRYHTRYRRAPLCTA